MFVGDWEEPSGESRLTRLSRFSVRENSMPYPQDLVGKYLNFKIDSGGSAGTHVTLVDGVLPNKVTRHSVVVYDTVPAAGPPPRITNPPWVFSFLKYWEGAVTTGPLGTPMMTGPLTGCYVFKYNRNGLHMAHVGTGATTESSTRAKQAWVNFAARPDVSGAMGGSASDYFEGERGAGVIRGIMPEVVCYIAAGQAYAIMMVRLPESHNPSRFYLMKVLAVKRMTLQPWSSIAAMRRFRDLQ